MELGAAKKSYRGERCGPWSGGRGVLTFAAFRFGQRREREREKDKMSFATKDLNVWIIFSLPDLLMPTVPINRNATEGPRSLRS